MMAVRMALKMPSRIDPISALQKPLRRWTPCTSRGHQHDHQRVEHEREQPERQDGDRQREEAEDRPQDRVQDAQHQRRDQRRADVLDFDAQPELRDDQQARAR